MFYYGTVKQIFALKPCLEVNLFEITTGIMALYKKLGFTSTSKHRDLGIVLKSRRLRITKN